MKLIEWDDIKWSRYRLNIFRGTTYYLWNKDDQQGYCRTKDDNTADEYVQRGRIFADYETHKNTDATQYYDVVNTDAN